MSGSAHAGQRPAPSQLVDPDALVSAYYDKQPDPAVPEQRVSFGTSGHRGTSIDRTFNEAHALAISEAICRYRRIRRIDGPLFLGRDTHALSAPACRTALEVLTAHGVDVMVAAGTAFTPTPVISHAILSHNRRRRRAVADGIVMTPSHNPPEDGGFKYNPPHGGPAGTDVTSWIEREANALLAEALAGVQRLTFEEAAVAPTVHPHDYVSAYVDDLPSVLDLEAIRASALRIGVDPLGGASLAFWEAIAERHRLNLTITNREIDPTFHFVPFDHDGRIRMDCSSPYVMAGLTAIKERFDISVANDPDADRHGIVTPSAGLLNPNHHLAACTSYLFGGHRRWPMALGVGKTIVSSSIIDRVAAACGRSLFEAPVGFKWFVEGLHHGSLGFCGEESAGATFLRRKGSVWTTDKDGFVPSLLAAEMAARTGSDPGEIYTHLSERFGPSHYRRVDVPATPDEKTALLRLAPRHMHAKRLAGEPIRKVLTRAPGNGEPIGGVKVIAEHGWFAARPSGTESVYKLYAESFLDPEHLERILQDAEGIVQAALRQIDAAA
ncbi:MAG: phosphoglucomutase (alpha-D-glucose-1,6-bisphosphate-dependent) [Gaiellaceae bacterium]